MTITNYYTSVSGDVERSVVSAEAWTTLRGGSGTTRAGNPGFIFYLCSGTTDLYARLIRTHIIIDTSALPVSADIQSARLYFYCDSKVDQTASTPNIGLYGATPISEAEIVDEDYQNIGTVEFATPIAYNSVVSGAWNYFELNATGISNIVRGGNTCLGTRNANYDVADIAPAWVASKYSGIRFVREGDNRPYLAITTPTVAYPYSFGMIIG